MLSWHRLAGEDALHRPHAQRSLLIGASGFSFSFGGACFLMMDLGAGLGTLLGTGSFRAGKGAF